MKKAQDDRLNCLGAGMLTAIGAHGLLCVAALPGILRMPHDGGLALLTKLVFVIWTLAGIPAAAYVGYKMAGIFNGRSYAAARLGAIGTMLLPLIGEPGAVTAFALIPAGIIGFVLLRRLDWKSAFQAEVSDVPTVSTEEILAEFHEPVTPPKETLFR